MSSRSNHSTRVLLLGFALSLISVAGSAIAQNQSNKGAALSADRARVVEYWNSERRANAVPRDLVIDHRGLGYLRAPGGSLVPYGHEIAASVDEPAPRAKPPGAGGGGSGGGNTDNTLPVIANLDPGSGAKIGASHPFSATVTDESGIKSVSFTIGYPDGVTTQSFNASKESGSDTWSVNLQGFTDDNWSWWVVAKDAAGKGGNSATSATVDFTVDTGGGSANPGVITNAAWTTGGDVQFAAGRIYFEMPNNAKHKGPWQGYVCSGTVVFENSEVGFENSETEPSLVLTAAHCVYDDVNEAFARNVLFIPDQANTTGSGTDRNCANDPIGCWVPSWGVVDVNWTTSVFPDNIPWDYAFYVVDDSGAHAQGFTPNVDDALDVAAGGLPISFEPPNFDDGAPGETTVDYTHALGYSYSDDPNFMYCAEDMTTEGADNWWLPSCWLSGGSSGGPWIQPMDTGSGSGPVMSVNSWGYANSPGMAGPKLVGTSAECVYWRALDSAPASTTDGDAGIAVSCD